MLCLPDEAAIAALSLLENETTKIKDASTTQRSHELFAYGFPELGDDFKNKLKSSRFISVPGCYATGFSSIVYPLTKTNISNNNYPLSCTGISGYSGAGKKGIALYEHDDKPEYLKAPRLYSMNQTHKHLKELK